MQINPAGGAAFFEDPGDGGEVDQVEAVALFAAPIVGVAEDVGLDVLAGEEGVEQSPGIFQLVFAGVVGWQDFPEIRAVVVVAQGEVDGEFGRTKWGEAFDESHIVAGETLMEGAVAVDEDGRGTGGEGEDFAADLLEIFP